MDILSSRSATGPIARITEVFFGIQTDGRIKKSSTAPLTVSISRQRISTRHLQNLGEALRFGPPASSQDTETAFEEISDPCPRSGLWANVKDCDHLSQPLRRD